MSVTFAVWLASGAGGCLLDEFGRDDLLDYVAWPFFISSPILLIAFFVSRRFERALNLQMRRVTAGQTRSSQAELTAVAPILYPTPAPASAETALLDARQRKYSRIVLPLLALWILSIVLVAAETAVAFASLLFLATSVLLVVFVRKLPGGKLLESQKRDQEAHSDSVRAEAARTAAAPVLYLRSFTDDTRAGRRYGALTEEEQLAKSLAWVGPVLAVGRPDEALPQVGAQRIYLAHEDWQTRVDELMARARLVLLRTGSSEGFRWEVKQALATLTPERLLLVVDDARELKEVLDTVARHVGRPAMRIRLRGPAIGTIRGLLMFGANWEPQPLRLVRGMLRVKESNEPLVGRFTMTLRPVFDRLGVPYTLPRYSKVKIGMILYLIVWALAIGIADYFDPN
jgi:hypothetical protein